MFTAALGPYVVNNYYPDLGAAQAVKQTALSRLQDLRSNQYEENLEVLRAEEITRAPIDNLKARPHAHGNL